MNYDYTETLDSSTTVWPLNSSDNIAYCTVDSLESVMQELGKHGYHVMVRYDPLREKNNWTIIVSFGMLAERADTDMPLSALCVWRDRHRWSGEQDVKESDGS